MTQAKLSVLPAQRPLAAVPDPRNLNTAARRITAPTSAEKAQLAGAASARGKSPAAAKDISVLADDDPADAKLDDSDDDREPEAAAGGRMWVGGNPPAVAKVWGGGMASRLIRFARGGNGGGKASPAEAAVSGGRGGSVSVTRGEQRRARRPDTPHFEKRRSGITAATQ